MLKPAQLYAEELNKKILATWYDPDYMWYNASVGEFGIDLPDNNEQFRHFVSVDENDNILGYISYTVDWKVKSAEDWGIVAFVKNSKTFGRDVHRAISDVFVLNGFQRIEFHCYADNPILDTYQSLVAKYRGEQLGIRHRWTRLPDGELHDSVLFEILKEQYFYSQATLTGLHDINGVEIREGDKLRVRDNMDTKVLGTVQVIPKGFYLYFPHLIGNGDLIRRYGDCNGDVEIRDFDGEEVRARLRRERYDNLRKDKEQN